MYGYKFIEAIRADDWVLSSDEHDPAMLPIAKRVVEIFQRQALILHLHFGDQVIRTTSEHPFYVWGRGWVEAGEMEAGDWCKSEDGRWVMLSDRPDTGELEFVYNFTVEDYHTDYVGQPSWGFALWAHNADYSQDKGKEKANSQIDRAKFKKEREAYWKSEAEENSAQYRPEELARMREGKPPISHDGYPMELHHKNRTPTGGLQPMTRTDHRLGDNYKRNHP